VLLWYLTEKDSYLIIYRCIYLKLVSSASEAKDELHYNHSKSTKLSTYISKEKDDRG